MYERRIDCDSDVGRMICDEVVAPDEIDADHRARDRSADRLGRGRRDRQPPRAAACRRAVRHLPPYAALYAREQALLPLQPGADLQPRAVLERPEQEGLSTGHQVGEARIGQQLLLQSRVARRGRGSAPRRGWRCRARGRRAARSAGWRCRRRPTPRAAPADPPPPAARGPASARRAAAGAGGPSRRAPAPASAAGRPTAARRARPGRCAEHGKQRQHLLDPLPALDGRAGATRPRGSRAPVRPANSRRRSGT